MSLSCSPFACYFRGQALSARACVCVCGGGGGGGVCMPVLRSARWPGRVSSGEPQNPNWHVGVSDIAHTV